MDLSTLQTLLTAAPGCAVLIVVLLVAETLVLGRSHRRMLDRAHASEARWQALYLSEVGTSDRAITVGERLRP